MKKYLVTNAPVYLCRKIPMSEDTFLHFISDQGVNTNKVSNNQNGSDVNNHLKKRKSISTSAMEGQRYKLPSCLYTKKAFPHC